jgi:hypothetical protein
MEKYDEYILKALKAAPETLGEVDQLVHVKGLPFNQADYAHLLEGLRSGQLPKSTELGEEETFREYVEIYKITAKNGAVYLATFYDSDALEQDPQLMDLIPMKP